MTNLCHSLALKRKRKSDGSRWCEYFYQEYLAIPHVVGRIRANKVTKKTLKPITCRFAASLRGYHQSNFRDSQMRSLFSSFSFFH